LLQQETPISSRVVEVNRNELRARSRSRSSHQAWHNVYTQLATHTHPECTCHHSATATNVVTQRRRRKMRKITFLEEGGGEKEEEVAVT